MTGGSRWSCLLSATQKVQNFDLRWKMGGGGGAEVRRYFRNVFTVRHEVGGETSGGHSQEASAGIIKWEPFSDKPASATILQVFLHLVD